MLELARMLNMFLTELSKQQLGRKGKIKKHLSPSFSLKENKKWTIPDRDLSILKPLSNAEKELTTSSSSNMPSTILSGRCARVLSLLPAFLVVVVVLWAAAGGGPLGAAVLLGLLQELVQTERILFKLDRSIPPLPMVDTRELFPWSKPAVGQKEKVWTCCKGFLKIPLHNWSNTLNLLADRCCFIGCMNTDSIQNIRDFHGTYVFMSPGKVNDFLSDVLYNSVKPCSRPTIPRGQWQAGD